MDILDLETSLKFVSHNGVGLNPEDFDLIFQPFPHPLEAPNGRTHLAVSPPPQKTYLKITTSA